MSYAVKSLLLTKEIALAEQNEFSLYTLQQELETSGSCELIPLLASVQDETDTGDYFS